MKIVQIFFFDRRSVGQIKDNLASRKMKYTNHYGYRKLVIYSRDSKKMSAAHLFNILCNFHEKITSIFQEIVTFVFRSLILTCCVQFESENMCSWKTIFSD